MALIHDEYGHFEGLVTPADILEAIAGVFHADAEGREPYAVERDGGSWLLSGAMPADEMAEQLGIALPEKRDYQTVAGFVLARLQHLPSTGESIEALGWRFEERPEASSRGDVVPVVARMRAPRRRAATANQRRGVLAGKIVEGKKGPA